MAGKPWRTTPVCNVLGCTGRMHKHSETFMKVTGETKIRVRCNVCHRFESHYILGAEVKIETRPMRRPCGRAAHPMLTPLLTSVAQFAALMATA
ncbi:hypothetical protein RHDC4_00741 [Rhodocyclaceae bacterium]|nr:hypothetical protein RHDC4_00741 [Rhodocyclaceae bacterium]